jgi:ABC-type transport system involved in cytochrome bd biosynthesis fused ATPase/permease subunit
VSTSPYATRVTEPAAAASSNPQAAAPEPTPHKTAGRLEAITRGERIEADVHASIANEEPVVEIDRFNLWYGAKQALFDISLAIPRGKVTALIGPSTRCASADTCASTATASTKRMST